MTSWRFPNREWRARPKVRWFGTIAILWFAAPWAPAVGQAQTAPGPVTPGPVTPGMPASAPALGPTGGRVGFAEVPIVGGNVASARERALAEAMKQAVEQALGLLIPDARTTQPKLVLQVLGRARTYVRRYRALEEGERGRGLFGMRIEADIDEAALLRAFDKPLTGVPATGAPPSASTPGYLLVGAGAPDAAEAVARALTVAGARVQPARQELAEPAKAFEAASRAGIPAVAFVTGNAVAEGKVRGPGLEVVSCSVSIRVLTSSGGLPLADESEATRSFAERPETARANCFQRAAGAVVPRIVPAAGARVAPDVRTIVLVAAVAQPAAVPALIKHVRGIGSVSAVEVRRITAGGTELWVRSRLQANALAAALARDAGGAVSISSPEVTGDLVRITVAFREPTPPPPATAAPPVPLPNNSPPVSPPQP